MKEVKLYGRHLPLNFFVLFSCVNINGVLSLWPFDVLSCKIRFSRFTYKLEKRVRMGRYAQEGS